MSDDQRITPDMAKKLGEQIRAVIASGSDNVSFELAGLSMDVVRTGDGGFAIGEPGQEGAARMYFEPAERPESYPPDMPFVPKATVTLLDTGGGIALMYWLPPDAPALVQELVDQTLAAGWLLESQQDIPTIGVINSLYGKGARERVLINAMGVVSVIEKDSR